MNVKDINMINEEELNKILNRLSLLGLLCKSEKFSLFKDFYNFLDANEKESYSLSIAHYEQ